MTIHSGQSYRCLQTTNNATKLTAAPVPVMLLTRKSSPPLCSSTAPQPLSDVVPRAALWVHLYYRPSRFGTQRGQWLPSGTLARCTMSLLFLIEPVIKTGWDRCMPITNTSELKHLQRRKFQKLITINYAGVSVWSVDYSHKIFAWLIQFCGLIFLYSML